VNADTLGLEVLARVGPRGSFLAEDHTVEHLRAGELIQLTLSERESRTQWEVSGMATMESRARDRARSILASHVVEPLPEEVIRELAQILAHADAELVH
jgi:trimethylamine--corrinoid protein Co-methyltransferase